jgi:hypothetical protein
MSLLKTFTAALQSSHLKAQGFQKRYETFSKSHAKFSEHYHLQSSLLNKTGDPWKYELIIGLGFHDIPSKQKGQLAGTHASKRAATIETVLSDHSNNDPQKLKAEVDRVSEIIFKQSEYFQRRYETLRHSYDRGISHEGFPADPEND